MGVTAPHSTKQNALRRVSLTLGYFAVYFGLGLEIVLATPVLQQLGFTAGEVGSLWAGRSLLSIAGPVFWGYYWIVLNACFLRSQFMSSGYVFKWNTAIGVGNLLRHSRFLHEWCCGDGGWLGVTNARRAAP